MNCVIKFLGFGVIASAVIGMAGCKSAGHQRGSGLESAAVQKSSYVRGKIDDEFLNGYGFANVLDLADQPKCVPPSGPVHLDLYQTTVRADLDIKKFLEVYNAENSQFRISLQYDQDGTPSNTPSQTFISRFKADASGDSKIANFAWKFFANYRALKNTCKGMEDALAKAETNLSALLTAHRTNSEDTRMVLATINNKYLIVLSYWEGGGTEGGIMVAQFP